MVNLESFFRISLFEDMTRGEPGGLDHALNMLIKGALEFKALELFSLTFGMGVAVQAERAWQRGRNAELFLLRRFSILLAIGLAQLVLVSNVDILTLYALCGFVLIFFLRLPAAVLALMGVALIYLPPVLPLGPMFPSAAVIRAHAEEATRVYSHGGFFTLVAYRWTETKDLIAPILEGVAQLLFGLMVTGMALWRSGIVRNPRRARPWLWCFAVLAGTVGAVNTGLELFSLHSPWQLRAVGSNVPLALAYGAAIVAWRRSDNASRLVAPIAAAGQMALTNYLTQTVVLALVFYGYGFGLMGRLSISEAALFGIAFYAAQLWFSAWWLARYRFGPFEWLWRSATYGRSQPFLLALAQAKN